MLPPIDTYIVNTFRRWQVTVWKAWKWIYKHFDPGYHYQAYECPWCQAFFHNRIRNGWDAPDKTNCHYCNHRAEIPK